MDTIGIGGPDRVTSRVALGTRAEVDKREIDDILTQHIAHPIGPISRRPPPMPTAASPEPNFDPKAWSLR